MTPKNLHDHRMLATSRFILTNGSYYDERFVAIAGQEGTRCRRPIAEFRPQLQRHDPACEARRIGLCCAAISTATRNLLLVPVYQIPRTSGGWGFWQNNAQGVAEWIPYQDVVSGDDPTKPVYGQNRGRKAA
jgi:hypothetical protein